MEEEDKKQTTPTDDEKTQTTVTANYETWVEAVIPKRSFPNSTLSFFADGLFKLTEKCSDFER